MKKFNNEKNTVTKEGLLEAQKEFENRKTIIRMKIADDIEKAREQGDLSENAAYKAAIEQNQFNEKKIVELDAFIANAVILDETDNKSMVGIGSKVKVINKETKQQMVFEIVGQNEANPSLKKISNLSPLGKTMIGKKENQEFLFNTPNGGKVSYIVLEIN